MPKEIQAGPLLSTIQTPHDLRKLKKSQLEQVCKELREYIIDVVSVNGGHFGASLGVVELTVALNLSLIHLCSYSRIVPCGNSCGS